MKLFIILFSFLMLKGFAMDKNSIRNQMDLLATGDNAWGAVSIIVYKDGETFFYSAGKEVMNENSMVEIGSNTKVFTGILLANAVIEKKVKFDQSINSLLASNILSEEVDQNVTLLGLSTYSSGIPRMPSNFAPSNENNPYAEYGFKELKGYLLKTSMRDPMPMDCKADELDISSDQVREEGQCYNYSNTGVALLGEVLGKTYKKSYQDLLHDQLISQLGLEDTSIELRTEQLGRFIQGYNWEGNKAEIWNFKSFAPTGGLKSTPSDMIKFLKSQLNPTQNNLGEAIMMAQKVHREVQGQKMGLGWHFEEKDDQVVQWHNGGTYGFLSFMGINKAKDRAIFIVGNQLKATKQGIDKRIDQLGLKLLFED